MKHISSRLLKTTAIALAIFPVLAFADAEPNTLTPEEVANGWRLLFDGKTTAGWVAIGKTEFPSVGWSVKDGALHHEKRGGGGDIVTEKSFRNFELVWEWKIGVAGNSGVKYNLSNPKLNRGFEYQILDDPRNGDAATKSHQTAALYDLIEPSPERKTRPAGEWNQSRLLVDGHHVEHWLNGIKILEFEIESPDMVERIAKSKWANNKDFGIKTESPILLQDHLDEVDFRSIKLREITGK